MIANFFSKTKPIHAIFIGAFFLVQYVLTILLVESPPFSLILLVDKFGLALFFLIFFFLFNFINRKNYLTQNNSFVLFFLVVLFGLFPKAILWSKELAAQFFLLFAFRRIYSIRTLKNVKQKLLDSGFWIGIATVIYAWSMLYLLLIIAAVVVYKRGTFKNLMIPIVGWIVPLFLVFTYCYVFGDVQQFYDSLVVYYSFTLNDLSDSWIVSLSILSLFLLISLVFVNLKFSTFSIDMRSSWILILIHLALALVHIVCAPAKGDALMVYGFFPVTIVLANYAQIIKYSIGADLFIYSLLAASFVAYFL